MADPTPNEKTIWHFHYRLCQAGVILDLFAEFDEQLHAHGMVAKEGRIVDASIIPFPVQHISRKERETLDRGEIPKEWKQNPAIQAQRDIDAAWTRKHNKSYSKVRARVEHTSDAIRMKMGDICIRSICEIRATFVIGMRNLLYNVCRLDSIQRIQVEMG